MSDIQIQKYKYTNTVQVKYADGPYMCYIFKSAGCKDIKYDIFDWMTRKIKISKIIKIIKMRLQGRL